jgi:hypothetical protein
LQGVSLLSRVDLHLQTAVPEIFGQGSKRRFAK